jgi:predicted O-linked N-acetylglucosamine transferase (SPINDLY family)
MKDQGMSEADTSSATDLVERGRLLHREGNLAAAERLYRQALMRDEDCAEAHQLLAVIAGQRGDFGHAITGFRRSIALGGPTAERMFNLAEAYRLADDPSAALEAYNQALTIDAGYLDAYRRAVLLIRDRAASARKTGNAGAAERFDRLAAHYLVGLGHACLRSGKIAEAERAYREAAELEPGNADSMNCLGTIALEAKRPVEAETWYRRALENDQRSPLYLNNIGRALLSQLRLDEAAEAFRRAIEIDATFAEARQNLEERTLPWLHYRSDLTAGAIFAAHQDWGRRSLAALVGTEAAHPSHANSRDPERPLTIAYIGVDASSRLARAFLEPLLANHDRRFFQTVVYITAATPAAADIRHFKTLATLIQPIGIQFRPQEMGRRLREQGVDIMVDLAGHAPHNRLDIFAHKPAPVEVTWLGYPGTTGLPTIDYRITDEFADPPGAEVFHTERLFRMKPGALVYRAPAKAPDISAPPARAPGAVVFGNFDDPRKISREAARSWSAILAALPSARLVLMAPEIGDVGFSERIRAKLELAGIDATRVELRQAPEDPVAILRAYEAIDIVLDTFPYHSDPATVCDALWMGLPAITRSGDRPYGRTSTCLLAQLGLERLDSITDEEYADTAIELAGDLDRLRALRASMRDRMRVSPLMDERDFARRFEAALREMWRGWCRG